MGMLTGRSQLTYEGGMQLESQIKGATKMLAASEDVGRRAISVAHLGDKRAYLAIRLSLANEGSSSSVLSVTPMEGIEEEGEEETGDRDSGTVTDDSSSTEIMASVRRRRSSSISMTDANKAVATEDELDEMPFAVQTDTAAPFVAAGLPTRASVSFNKEEMAPSGPRPTAKPTPVMIRSHFSEALSCYLKALKMLKGAVGAAEGVLNDLNRLAAQRLSADQLKYLGHLRKRCDVTMNWLGNQFRGVLERADAANVEIGKLPLPPAADVSSVTSVEELLYNNSLGFGREAAVKQLLGQYEAARSCYRSAGLLAETLLMEQKVEGDDRKFLEGYVNGFAAQITALDELLLQQSQQSRLAASSATAHSVVSSRRASASGFASPPFAMDSSNK